MVEKPNEADEPPRRKRPDHERDWRPILYEHEAGTPIAEIAARLDLTESWVKTRLLRETRALPSAGPARLAVKLQYFLEQAEARLGGDPAATEKTARAVLAMTKAAEAVAAFSAAHSTPTEASADNDEEKRAEIIRRLDRLAAEAQSEAAGDFDGD